MSLLLLNRGHRLREAAGWLCCGAIVLVVHGGAVAYMLQEPLIVAAEAPAAIMIELAELPVAPEAEQLDVAPGPQMMEAQEKTEEEVPPDPLAKEEDVPEPPPLPETEPVPEVSESPAPDIEVPLPPPPPQMKEETPPEKKPDTPKPRPKPKPREREKSERPPAPRTSAAPAVEAARADRLAAPSAGISNANSRAPANWRSRLMGHLNRHKRFPGAASGSGKVRVAFSIDRSGQVLSSRVVGSSGNPAFDQEALALLRRASPLPAPPPEVGGNTISFTVPIDFTRR